MPLALDGIKIIDSAHQYPGPYCSMLLGDLGADIIKVERPLTGDPARRAPGFFRSLNRNKRSLTLDLKIPAARDILYRLVATADVFTEGFRPGVAKRLGIGYEDLRRVNPGLVYCSISGYGQEGPYRDLPGHDLNYMAMAGMSRFFKDSEGNLVAPGIAVGDLSSGMFAAFGILAALLVKGRTGRGQYVDVSMFDGLLSWLSTYFGILSETGSSTRLYDAGYGIFEGGDGEPFTLGIAHEDWFWERLCRATGLEAYEALKSAERRARRDELRAVLQAVFSQKPRAEWVRILTQADVPVAPVQTLEQVAGDPHVAFREMIRAIPTKSGKTDRHVGFPIKLSETPWEIRVSAPDLGEHTDEILRELGCSPSEIDQLRDSGAV